MRSISAWVHASVRMCVRACVRADISQNQLTFCSETLPIYFLPLCHAFSQVSENWIQNTRLFPRAVFRDLCIYSKNHMSAGSAAQIFNFFKSVPYLCAMCSPKFQTILIQNGRLGAILRIRALLTKLWFFFKSHVYGKRCLNFQLFPNLFVASIPALWSNIYFVGDIIALTIYLFI